MNIDNYVLSLSNILKRIDEYELYCHYLGFEPEIRETYSSPIRDDDEVPSFSFYSARQGPEDVEFMWKDGALNKSGTIVHLVKELYGLIDYRDALRKIDTDFKLGFTDGTFEAPVRKIQSIRKPVDKPPAVIQVSSRENFSQEGLEYWESFGISLGTLKTYNVTQIFSSIINGTRINYREIAFAYRIADKYKIYCPTKTKFRFLNNYDSRFVEGFSQLPNKSDTLIITKSLKDVMVLHELGHEAISPRSETTVIPGEYFKWINANYKRVLVLFDNDMKHNGDKYPYPKDYVPLHSGCKDISDYVKKYGKEEGKCLISTMLDQVILLP